MRINISISIVFLFCSFALQGQNTILDAYIDSALSSNIALKQQNYSYEKSLAALNEAKALYWPSLDLSGRYSLARGGRMINFPVGDLMNPVYNNLNLINQQARQANPDYPEVQEYPQLENISDPFLRTAEYEAFVRLSVPIFNAAIQNNHKIKAQLNKADGIGVMAYKRQLVKEVKQAYFGYLQATAAKQLYTQTIDLVQENLRTSKSLHRYDQVTVDVVYAAEAEVKRVEVQQAQAESTLQQAISYFNFLLNRPYQAPIEVEAMELPTLSVASLDQARARAFQQREELQQLSYFTAAAEQKAELERDSRLPQVNLALDYGIQGVDLTYDEDSDFAMGSLVVQMNLFDKSRKHRVQQATIERQIVEQRQAELRQQIGLQVVEAHYAQQAAWQSIALAKDEVRSTQKAYDIVERKFKQGQASIVELTSARTQLTNAQQRAIIARNDYQSKWAAYEFATGDYPLQ